jgi:hypothetical protein
MNKIVYDDIVILYFAITVHINVINNTHQARVNYVKTGFFFCFPYDGLVNGLTKFDKPPRDAPFSFARLVTSFY